MNSLVNQRTQKLKEMATRHGFMGVGIAKAEFMQEEATRLEAWLSKGYHGEMSYMANHFDKRLDPTKLVPGAKSVISLMYNYYPGDESNDQEVSGNEGESKLTVMMPEARQIPDERHFTYETLLTTRDSQITPDESHIKDDRSHKESSGESIYKISRYAFGEDYHKVVRRKLKALVRDLKEEFGDFHGRVFVDSAPVMERDWAKRSGQGWIGKNTLLIHPKKGSYFFLAEIILDLQFEYDHPIRDHCGTCTRCIDACPTDAISPQGYVLDGSKCISYLTIELKSNIPEAYHKQMGNWIFGCDICQEVCPWNRFATSHDEPAFIQSEKFREMKNEDWLELTEEIFDELFSKSPLKRAGHSKLLSTIKTGR